ncbi:MAG: hypothetical protein H6713_15955 [Myxococcales bacterium]|nr:hypothetical protein [Myxococcales bacterium]
MHQLMIALALLSAPSHSPRARVDVRPDGALVYVHGGTQAALRRAMIEGERGRALIGGAGGS